MILMKAKEYLSQARRLENQINSKLQQLSRYRALATKVTSVLSSMPHSTNRNKSPMESALTKLIDFENEIDSDIYQLIEIKKEISEFIIGFDEAKYIVLLELRYLSGLTWGKIAETMGFDLSWTYRLHRKALEQAELRLTNQETIED